MRCQIEEARWQVVELGLTRLRPRRESTRLGIEPPETRQTLLTCSRPRRWPMQYPSGEATETLQLKRKKVLTRVNGTGLLRMFNFEHGIEVPSWQVNPDQFPPEQSSGGRANS